MKIKLAGLSCSLIGLVTVSRSQSFECFGHFNFDSAYSVICIRGLNGEAPDEASQYNFVVDDHDGLMQLKKDWVVNMQPNHESLKMLADICIVKEKKFVTTACLFFRSASSFKMCLGGNCCPVFPEIVEDLHRSHPLNYISDKRTFSTIEQYQAYYDSIMKQPSLLFIIEPNTKMRGRFTIKVKKSAKYPHPKATIEKLTEEFIRFVPKDEFLMSYGGSLDDALDTVFMKIHVSSSKRLFDAYRNKNFEISEWQPADIFVRSFWRL